MDPLKGPSLQICSCSSLHTVHRPIGAPNTSSYVMRNVGGKRESLSFYCPDLPLYIENVALRAMYSLSMLEHVQSTHEHSMYSMISMVITRYVLLSSAHSDRYEAGVQVCIAIFTHRNSISRNRTLHLHVQ
jgi:hypothetical protein